LWGEFFRVEAYILGLGISSVFVILFPLFSNFIKKITEKTFVHPQYDPLETIRELLRTTSTELELEKVVVNILALTKKTLRIDRAGMILFDRENRRITYEKLIGFNKNGPRKVGRLLEVVNLWDIQESKGKKSEIFVYDEISEQMAHLPKDELKRLNRIVQFMKEEKIAILLPLNRKVQLNGLMVVGYKHRNEAYTEGDINLLESIVANASVAVGRALLYAEVENFAQTLQAKVDVQTKSLQKKIDEIKETRKREHDMIDTMGHELRTPMTIIRDYHKLLTKHIFKLKLTAEEKRTLNKYIDVIEKNIDREIDLTNTLLNATKLDDGKIKLMKEPLSVIEIIDNGIIGQEKLAKEKGLRIIFEKPNNLEKFPTISADRIRIQEVIDNLLNNAVKYTEKGSVNINVSSNKRSVQIEVQDTGIGIPEEDLDNLGEKFFRSDSKPGKNGKSKLIVRPGGTGLGLFVTFGIVKEHGGSIDVKSKLGEGSTFTVKLPIATTNNSKEIQKIKRKTANMFKRLDLEKEKSNK
jgi:signal transduction histidine kinase